MMKNILYKLFYKLHPYFSSHPYNFFWSKSIYKLDHLFMKDDPINVVDVGGRGGELPELTELTSHINYFTFDADKEEAANLERKLKLKNFNSVTVFDRLLYSKEQYMTFNLFKSLGESSVFLPNKAYQKYYDGNFDIKSQINLAAVTLDSLVEQNKLFGVDLFKLDTQGSELDILKGSQKTIEALKPVIIETEVEFFEMYSGQPLFHDITAWLQANGYQLLYLNRVFMSRRNFKGFSRGQMIFGDALFGIRDTESLTVSKKIKYIILLINYGLIDMAFDVFHEDEKLKSAFPDLQIFFDTTNKTTGFFTRIKTAIFDALLFKLLMIRKGNKLKYDSDRSYPIR